MKHYFDYWTQESEALTYWKTHQRRLPIYIVVYASNSRYQGVVMKERNTHLTDYSEIKLSVLSIYLHNSPKPNRKDEKDHEVTLNVYV